MKPVEQIMSGWAHTKANDTNLNDFMPSVKKTALLPGEFDFEKEEQEKLSYEDQTQKDEAEVRKYITELGPEMASGKSGKAFRAWRSLPSFPRKQKKKETDWQKPTYEIQNNRIALPQNSQTLRASWMNPAPEPVSWMAPPDPKPQNSFPRPSSSSTSASPQKRSRPLEDVFQRPSPLKRQNSFSPPEPKRHARKEAPYIQTHNGNEHSNQADNYMRVGPPLKPTPRYKRVPPPKDLDPHREWKPVHRKQDRRRRSRSPPRRDRRQRDNHRRRLKSRRIS